MSFDAAPSGVLGTDPGSMSGTDPDSLIHAKYWPKLEPATLAGVAKAYSDWATHMADAAQTSDVTYVAWFAEELLQGDTGDHVVAALRMNASTWRSHSHVYSDAASLVTQAAGHLHNLKGELQPIIDECQSWWEWGKFLRWAGELLGDQKLVQVGQTIMTDALNAAEALGGTAATNAAATISSTLAAAFKNFPGLRYNGGGNNGGGIVTTGYDTPLPGGQGVTSGGTPVTSTGTPSTGGQTGSGTSGSGSNSSGTGGSSSGANGANPGSGSASGGNPSGTPTTGSDGSAPASGSSGQPDPGSGSTQPVTQSSPGGGSAPTSDGSGGSPAVSTAPVTSSGTPMVSSTSVGSNAPASSGPSRSGQGQGQGQGQNSGSSSGGDGTGLATSGVVPSTMQPVPVLGGQGHPGAGALGPMHGMAGGAPHSVDTGGGGGSGGLGGGGMMPMSPTPGPLAPYSPPGAGVPSPNAPAQTQAPPSAAAPAGAAAAGGGGLIAGSSVGARKAATATKRVNPDVEAAQRVLAGLVKACPTRPIFWAVSVLRTPVGPQTLIACSVGGGAYLPAEVSVPSTVRLAVLDPSLPADWAAEWMGWQSPLAILVDHYERVTKVVAGVTVSAMTTSELWPTAPECGGDFAAVRHEELVTSAAPPLVGGHRLTATDPALAARLTALDRGGDVTNFVAAQLTRAVWIAGSQPDDTGMPIAVKEDADLLGLVAQGAATREHWEDYRRDVERRAEGAVMMPETHAPRDADDSPGSVTARMWYRHYYAQGRIAEMVTCWESQPVSLLDLAYCGVAAGFGAVIAAVVTELEKQLAQPPGSTDGTP
jgi:hypothetical protein